MPASKRSRTASPANLRKLTPSILKAPEEVAARVFGFLGARHARGYVLRERGFAVGRAALANLITAAKACSTHTSLLQRLSNDFTEIAIINSCISHLLGIANAFAKLRLCLANECLT